MEKCVAIRQILLAATVAVAAGALAGCPPKPNVPSAPKSVVVLGPAPIVGNEPTTSGVYLAVPRDLTGAALAKAKSDRATILATVRANLKAETAAPAPATQPTTAPATTSAAEPPPLAVKYYLKGRERFLEGANTEAMEQLEKALQLDPQAFTVLRLMGRVCFAANQLARGNYYLQKAYAIRPQDVEVNYLTGRFYLEIKDYNMAIHHLAQATASPERDPKSAFTPLTSFYLARSLQQAGYEGEAAVEFGTFLELINQPVATYRYDRELSFLTDERWASHLAAAENFVAVGDFTHALPHYLAAASLRQADMFIASRYAAALVHAGILPQAQMLATQIVLQSSGSEDSVKLAQWVYGAEGREGELLKELRKQLAEVKDRAAATRTLVAVMDQLGTPAEAAAIIDGELAKDPGNLDYLGALMARLEKSKDYRAGLRAASATLAAAPEKYEDVLKLLQPLMGKRPEGFVPDGGNGYALYLDALAIRLDDRTSALAQSELEKSVQLAGDFFPAREALVRSLLASEKFAAADKQIEAAGRMKSAGDAVAVKVVILQMESAMAQHRYADAVRIGREGKAQYPRSTDIRMALAAVYRLRGQNQEAEGELIATIDEFPKFEPAYQRLIDGYLARGREGGQALNERMISESVAILGRLVREVPTSQFGQLMTALLYARTGRLEESQRLLERMLKDSPDNGDFLVPLAEIRFALGDREGAVTLLSESLERKASGQVGATLAEILREQGRSAEASALLEKQVAKYPSNEEWLLLYASELLSTGKREAAVKLLEKAVVDYPMSEPVVNSLCRLLATEKREGEAVEIYKAYMKRAGETTTRLYFLSFLQTQAKKPADTEATLLKILEIIPNHTGANNDLGYYWIDSGKHIQKATVMVQKSLANQPNNEAFLDSLAWGYYKQGKFNEAVRYLNQAIALPGGMESEILSHLGDALYRAGKKDEAVERWIQAQALMGSGSQQKTPLKEYVDRVLRQIREGKTPELSPLGEGVKEEREL